MKTGIVFGAVALLAAGAASAETMKVAADVGYSPHVMASASGGVEGYNVDIMNEIAKRMGVKHEVIDQEWSGIFAGLAAGKYTLRCRTIDDKGIAQPLPRPFRKSGRAAIEKVPILVKE